MSKNKLADLEKIDTKYTSLLSEKQSLDVEMLRFPKTIKLRKNKRPY